MERLRVDSRLDADSEFEKAVIKVLNGEEMEWTETQKLKLEPFAVSDAVVIDEGFAIIFLFYIEIEVEYR